MFNGYYQIFFFKLKTALCTSSIAVGISLKHSIPFLSLSHTFFKIIYLFIFSLILKLKFQVFNNFFFIKKKFDCELHMPAIDLECMTSPSIPLFLYGRRKCDFN